MPPMKRRYATRTASLVAWNSKDPEKVVALYADGHHGDP
jgi:hypothetical protein